jgi:hypothetical protein
MNTKPGLSKIRQLESDLRNTGKLPVRKVTRRHFDFGLSINLSCDEQSTAVSEPGRMTQSQSLDSDFVRPEVLQFANTDFYVEPFKLEPVEPAEPKPKTAFTPYTPDHTPQVRDGEVYEIHPGFLDQTPPDTEPVSTAPGYRQEYSEDSAFEDDIKAILIGKKKYNEEQKQVVDSAGPNAGSNEYSEGSSIKDNHNNGLRSQDVTNPHAIFDSLAKSFGSARSYDLGTFNLDKSFSDIEETISRQEKNAIEAKNRAKRPTEIQDVVSPPNWTEAPELQLSALDVSEDFALISEDLTNNPRPSTTASVSHDREIDAQSPSRQITSMSAALPTPSELVALLSYLQIGYNQFQPVENRYFARLKELLVFHNIMGAGDVLSASNFKEKVMDFQRRIMNDATPDGLPGEETLFELQKGWAGHRGLSLITTGIRNDAYKGSQIPFVMRSDVLARYNPLYDQVHVQGGVITSAGSLRSLTAPVTPGRSTTSMHYTGLAMDLHTGSGMQTTSDPYLIERNGTNGWHVYNRATEPFGDVRSLSAQIYNSSSKIISPVTVNERVIDFTQIANANGFYDIGNRSCFPQDYMCAEWWHFQCEDVLVPYISQFGSELLSIYSESQLTAQPHIWQSRKKIFKKNWF